MFMARLLLALILIPSTCLRAQTITVKAMVGPFPFTSSIPASLGGGLEVGLSPRSSLQLSGFYRIQPTGYGTNQGPKFYLDYRYYIEPQKQKNSGFYVSPFVGIGHQQLGDDGDTFGLPSHVKTHTLGEQFAGFVLGYQPYRKLSRFTVNLYAGPKYEWRTEQYSYNDSTHLPTLSYNKNRVWFRAGLTLCLRVKK